MFTDRYIKLPIKIYDLQQEDFGKDINDCDFEIHDLRVNHLEIASYHACYPRKQGFGGGNPECTIIMLKSGQDYQVYLTIDEFEKILNSHSK